jgi:hypothetical protein
MYVCVCVCVCLYICIYKISKVWKAFFLVVKGPAADAADALQRWGLLCNPVMKMTMMIIIFCPFPSNGAPMEWNWQGKTEVLGEKPVPVPLCPPQIPHRLARDLTRAFAVGGRRLTAWAMARPLKGLWFQGCWLVRPTLYFKLCFKSKSLD